MYYNADIQYILIAHIHYHSCVTHCQLRHKEPTKVSRSVQTDISLKLATVVYISDQSSSYLIATSEVIQTIILYKK